MSNYNLRPRKETVNYKEDEAEEHTYVNLEDLSDEFHTVEEIRDLPRRLSNEFRTSVLGDKSSTPKSWKSIFKRKSKKKYPAPQPPSSSSSNPNSSTFEANPSKSKSSTTTVSSHWSSFDSSPPFSFSKNSNSLTTRSLPLPVKERITFLSKSLPIYENLFPPAPNCEAPDIPRICALSPGPQLPQVNNPRPPTPPPPAPLSPPPRPPSPPGQVVIPLPPPGQFIAQPAANQNVGQQQQQQVNMANEKTDFIDSVPIFNEDDSIESYIKSIESHASIGNWQDRTKITVAKMKMRGTASDIVTKDPTFRNINTWADMKAALKEAFKPRIELSSANYNLLSCTQQPNELVQRYNVRFGTLFGQFLATQQPDPAVRARNQVQNDQLQMRYFINGLRPQIKQHVGLSEPNTYDEALQKAKDVEKHTAPPAVAFPQNTIHMMQPTASSSASIEDIIDRKLTAILATQSQAETPRTVAETPTAAAVPSATEDKMDKLTSAMEKLTVCLAEYAPTGNNPRRNRNQNQQEGQNQNNSGRNQRNNNRNNNNNNYRNNGSRNNSRNNNNNNNYSNNNNNNMPSRQSIAAAIGNMFLRSYMQNNNQGQNNSNLPAIGNGSGNGNGNNNVLPLN